MLPCGEREAIILADSLIDSLASNIIPIDEIKNPGKSTNI